MTEQRKYQKFKFKTLTMKSKLEDTDLEKITKVDDLSEVLKQILMIQRQFAWLNQAIAQRTNWMLTIFGAIIGFIIGFCLDIFLGFGFNYWVSWVLVLLFIIISTLTAAMLGFKSKRYLEFEKIIKNIDILIFKLEDNKNEPLNLFLFEDLKLYKNLFNGILLTNKEISNKISNKPEPEDSVFNYQSRISPNDNHRYIQENAYIQWQKGKIPTKNWEITLKLVKKYNELIG